MNFNQILNKDISNSLKDNENNLRKFASLDKNNFELDKEYKDNLFDKLLNDKIKGNSYDQIKFSNGIFKIDIK
jgi:hypothetical protein